MANQYLVQIHEFISTRIDQGRQARDEAQARQDRAQVEFMEGRLEELKRLRGFMSDHFDLDTQRYY